MNTTQLNAAPIATPAVASGPKNADVVVIIMPIEDPILLEKQSFHVSFCGATALVVSSLSYISSTSIFASLLLGFKVNLHFCCFLT